MAKLHRLQRETYLPDKKLKEKLNSIDAPRAGDYIWKMIAGLTTYSSLKQSWKNPNTSPAELVETFRAVPEKTELILYRYEIKGGLLKPVEQLRIDIKDHPSNYTTAL